MSCVTIKIWKGKEYVEFMRNTCEELSNLDNINTDNFQINIQMFKDGNIFTTIPKNNDNGYKVAIKVIDSLLKQDIF